MDLAAVHWRKIRKVTDLEELIAELTSPYCTLEGLGLVTKPSYEFVRDANWRIRERFASALCANKTLKSLDVGFFSDMLKVDDLCTLLQSNEVLKSLTVSSKFAKSLSVSTSLMVMLQKHSTLKRLGIVTLYEQTRDVAWLAGVFTSGSLEQFTVKFPASRLLSVLEKIFEVLAVNTNLRCLELIGYHTQFVNGAPAESTFLAVFSRNEGSDHQANKTPTRLRLPLDLATTMATILRSNQTIRELVFTETETILRVVSPPELIVNLLQALEKNNTLRLLDLSGCSAVQERQDLYHAVLNCVETKPWLHLNLQDTPLSKSEYRFTTIQQKLQQNAKFREAFGDWNPQLVKPTGARVFLCGSPRAGKCRSHLPQVMSHIIFFEQILTSKGGY
jgi:hypothetical protein